MITVPQYIHRYVVYQYNKPPIYYNCVLELIAQWCLSNKSNWLTTEKRIKISSDFEPYCTRCRQPISNDQTNNVCFDKKQHQLIYSIIVRDEFGVTYSDRMLHELYDSKPINNTLTKLWMYKNDSQWSIDWNHKNRHLFQKHQSTKAISSYRNIKTINERRQYDACLVDIDSPNIRGRRSKNSLPSNYDDIIVTVWDHAKNWKTKRVRKQWMINLN